jgi:hypothetical protein
MLAKNECEGLLDVLLPFGEDQLKKYKEFYPYGAVVRTDGTVELTSTYDGNEHPDSKAVINDLILVHKSLAEEGKIKVSGIAWNASMVSGDGKPYDAIIVSLEHKDDYSVIVGEPYKIGLFKKVTFGNLFAMEGKHDIF